MKRGTYQHRKVRRLAKLLSIERWGALGIVEALVEWAQAYAQDGDLGKHDSDELADAIGWGGDPDALLRALVSSGWVDEADGAGPRRIHEWAQHADHAIHMHLGRTRKRFADGTLPNLSRLNQAERTKAEEAFGVRTPCAQRDPMRVARPAPPRPAPPEGVLREVRDETNRSTRNGDWIPPRGKFRMVPTFELTPKALLIATHRGVDADAEAAGFPHWAMDRMPDAELTYKQWLDVWAKYVKTGKKRGYAVMTDHEEDDGPPVRRPPLAAAPAPEPDDDSWDSESHPRGMTPMERFERDMARRGGIVEKVP